MVNEAKQNYTLSKLKEHEKDLSKFWKDIKSLIPNMKNRSVDSIFNPAAERLCTGKEANDLMNDYFINIGNDLASNLPTCNTGYDHDDTCSTSLPVFEELTKDHLLKILKKISITKSSGLEEINTRILVDAFTSIPELLVKFYNLSLKNSQIPACLKISKVTPLPKKR